MRFLIYFVFCCAQLCSGVPAIATQINNNSPSLGYWLDTTGHASVDELETQTFQPFDGLLHKGFTPSALWIKLNSANWSQGAPDDTLVIRVRPSFLDHVTLYLPQETGTHITQETGDMTAWRDVNYASLNLGFKIKRAQLAPYVYLRVQTTSTLMVSVEVMSEAEAARADQTQQLWYAITLSMIAMFWCWIFISWLQHRDQLRRVFVIKQLLSFFYTLGFFGYYRIFLTEMATPELINLIFNFTVVAVTTAAFWYEINFISQYRLNTWFKKIMRWALVIPAFAFGLILIGKTQQAMHLNMLFIGSVTVLLFINGFTLDASQPNPEVNERAPYLFSRTVLVIYYSVLCLALMVNVVTALGLNIGLEFGLHNFVLHGIISGVMMTFLLQVRAHKIEQEAQTQSNALYLTQRQLALEQAKRDEQLQFLHMLTHELKTPLSVIDLVLKSSTPSEKTRAYANRAVADMKSIIERCVDVDRIDEGHIHPKHSSFHLNELIQRILQSASASERAVETDVPDHLTLTSDPQYVQIILGNLIENALRYGAADQAITIKAYKGSNEMVQQLGIEISNTPAAAGWPDPEQVFSKYYRNPKALNLSGTGLGLFLVSRLATILGGRCVYAPTTNQVRFILWIPN